MITDFSQRSSVLSDVVARESERIGQLDEAIKRFRSQVPSSMRQLNSQPLVVNSLSQGTLCDSWLSQGRSVDDEQLRLHLNELHHAVNHQRQTTDALRREVYHWYQRHVRLTQDHHHIQKQRMTAVDNRQDLAYGYSAVERLLNTWKADLERFLAFRNESHHDSSDTTYGTSEEAHYDALIVEVERKRELLRRKRLTLEEQESTSRHELEQNRREISVLQRKFDDQRREQQPIEDVVIDVARLSSTLRQEVDGLERDVTQAKRQQSRFLNSYTAKFIAATMFPPSNHLPLHMESRIHQLRGEYEGEHRISEAMALLKSTIVHFDTDLKRLRAAQRLVEGELENAFKVSHNEMKVVVTMCIPKDDVRRFSRTGHTREEWPITQHMLEAKFPAHKIETVNDALQTMVVAWDGMSQDAKARLTTAQDVVANAHLLFMIACYVSLKRTQKWALKYQQVMDARLPKAAGGVGYY